jgi:hypothetical protein
MGRVVVDMRDSRRRAGIRARSKAAGAACYLAGMATGSAQRRDASAVAG